MMTLGELTAALAKEPADKHVRFDALDVVPTEFDSYRGYYNELALGFDGSYGATKKAGQLFEQCKAAHGAIYEGWKGGNYRMDEKSVVYVANRGNAGGFSIVGIHSDKYYVTLKVECTDP